MTAIADQEARRRFTSELDRNFSVIASAGSGKTRAITDRIVEIAKDRQRAAEWLPQLVVVTYTNRAADEMQQRTRQRILEAGLPLETVEAFGRAFFGTIHAFCVKLLTTHGHRLGLPARLELVTDDDDLWNEFVQQQTTIGRSLSDENRRLLLRLMQARQLMELARNQDHNFAVAEPSKRCPECDFTKVEAAIETAQATNIPKAKAQLRNWIERWRKTDHFAPWPPCATTEREFVRRWREAFRPLREWASACASCVAAEVQRDYRDFRLARGAITYADQVALATELLRVPDVAKRIREKNYRVILDEAQDTDPSQFFVLLEITRPPEATGEWLEDRQLPPRAGHFSMVGDFQQSIYREPHDLNHYRELHRTLIETRAAEELKFSVTFRLDRAQLEFVNETFAKILNNEQGQVEFVELSPRSEILPGQVIRFELGADVDLKLTETQRARIEAQRLAKWIRGASLEKLRARSWREVAILCPRKAWLSALRDALLAEQIPVEVQSENDRQAEQPAYAWLTALLATMADPNSSYQIVGVLREVFGISDDELARFAQGDGYKFQIERRTKGRGLVPETLNLLTRIRETLPHQPLFSAVGEIVRMTQLRERLRTLPREELGDSVNELEKLLSAAAAVEAQQQSLADFALTLRRNFDKIRETEPAETDAIQLITAHKAKGSEWDAVIVPFLAREARLAPSGAYPRIIPGERPQIAFDYSDVADVKDQLERIQRQEMERLLYVALTRARHTLVFALDSDFFRGARGQVHSDTQLKWLKADAGEPNARALAAASETATTCGETTAHHEQRQPEPVPESLSALQLETGWIDLARQKAGTIIETVSPSQLAPEEEAAAEAPSTEEWIEIDPELRPARIDNPATRYGVWWHDFAEQISWVRAGLAFNRSEQSELWEKAFQASVLFSPDQARSKREWQLLQKQIEASDGLAGKLRDANIVRQEMPFFLQVNGKSVEGIVDLALFGENEVFILDWKTNRIAAEKIDVLRDLYRPQMAAYWQAISNLTNARVTAAIYSTATGQLVIYDPDELTTEWQRLAQAFG
jgi:ATP-dependent exoDNAse (exonuclease V) beta subunit